MPQQDKPEPARRVLVVGHDLGSRAVDSCVWNNVFDFNLVEYDDLILDLVPFQIRGRVKDPLRHMIRQGQLIRHYTRQHTRTIIIGPPKEDAFNPQVTGDLELETLGIPVKVKVIREAGTVVIVRDAAYGGYFQRLIKKTRGYLVVQNLSQTAPSFAPVAHQLGLPPKDLVVSPSYIAINPALEALALNMRILGTGTRGQTPNQTGEIIWLPQPTETESLDGVLWILKNICGVLLERPEPEWAEQFQLPEEAGVRQEIEGHTAAIAAATKAKEDAEQRLANLARLRRILYEQDDSLEQTVRDMLAELGAKVTPPAVKGREDGRAVDPAGRNYMLEIKGRAGTLKLEDVRQLDQWVEDAKENEGWTSKGLQIVNLKLGLPPADRKDIIPPNCMDLIKRNGFCLLTTSQLFQALVEKRRGRLDVNAFWDALHGTVGVAALPDLALEKGEKKKET